MKYTLGAKIDKNRKVEKEYSISATILPTFVLTNISMLPVLNQGQEPACVGHAFANAVNYDYFKKTGSIPLSSPRWNYGVGKLIDGNTEEGTSALSVFNGCKKYGGSATCNTVPNDITLPVIPYTQVQINPTDTYDAEKYPISSEVDIPSPTAQQLMSLINEYGVVPIAVSVDEVTWMQEDGANSLKPGTAGDHEILCFGYDTRNLNGDVRFFILNSWDKTWGNGGTGTFMWSDYQGNVFDAMSITVNTMPTIQSSTTSLIEQFEGFRPTPYLDTAEIWTIGIGFRQINGVPVTVSTPAMTLTEAQTILATQLQPYASAVTTCVKVPLTQSKFDALCSFTYNLGIGSLESSTLLKDINAGITFAENIWTEWDKETVNGVLVQSAGLLARRTAEYNLFIS